MKKLPFLRVAPVLGALLLLACDSGSPSEEVVLEEIEPIPVSQPSAVDPESIPAGETLSAAVHDPDPYARARRLATLLPTLGPESVPAVVALLNDSRFDPGAAGLDLLLRFWASHDPEAATVWAVEESAPAYRPPAILTALPIWAEADPQAARAKVEFWEQARPGDEEILPIALVRGWYAADPAGVARFIAAQPMGFRRQRSLSAFVRVMLQQEGPELTMRWAESVSEQDPSYKLAVYRQVAGALPFYDHEAAIRWCAKHCDGPHGKNLRSIIARRWVLRDGAAALLWLSEAPDSHENRVAVRRVFAIWSQREPDEALAWMAANALDGDGEPVSWLEPIYPVYARLLAARDPSEALAWAMRIPEDQDRELVLIDVARIWRARDEAAAEAWLAESPLSEEAREKARAPARGHSRALAE